MIYSTDAGTQITTNNVTVNPFSGGSTGALAESDGEIIFSPGSVIAGNYSTAAWARTGGQIIFQSGSAINPSFGGGSIGLLAEGTGEISATGLTVSMSTGGATVGAEASGGGTITLDNSSISIPSGGGGSTTGLLATGAGSTITTTNTDVIIPLSGGAGGSDTAVHADDGGAIELNGGTVSVTGAGGGETGLSATDGSTITGNGVTVTVTSPAGAIGGNIQNGSTISLTGGSVTTTADSGGYGFQFATGTNELNLDGVTVSSAQDAFNIQSGTANISTIGSDVTGRNGTLMNSAGGSTVSLTSDNSVLTGAIQPGGGGGNSTVILDNGTTWNMTGSSTVTSLTNNDSAIIFTPPSPGHKTLSVNDYTGTGGTITLNTFLGADNSPSDQLVVSGTATGTTGLIIQNTTGPGDQTIANGIPVVVTTGAGTTDPTSFTLAAPVRGGAYDYRLYRGGIDGGVSSPNDWFLRSTFTSPVTPVIPSPVPPGTQPPPVFPPPVLPPEPPIGVLPPGTFPITGPEIPSYGVVQPAARQLGLAILGTLNKRVGDTITAAHTCAGETATTHPGWLRFFGEHNENHYRQFADPRTDGWTAGLQGGFDVLRSDCDSAYRDSAGFYFAYGRASMDVTGLVTNADATGYELTRTGSLDLEAYTGGVYWTRYTPAGWYLDAVLQGTRYVGEASSTRVGLPTRGYGFIASLEAGYPIWIGSSFVLEPQAQIIWQSVSFRATSDALGPVALGSTSAPTGRIGLRGRWNFVDGYGTLWQPYAGVNLWRDWNADATTMYGPVDTVPLIQHATRLEWLGGVTAKLGNRTSLYAEASYQHELDNDDLQRKSVRANVGFRHRW